MNNAESNNVLQLQERIANGDQAALKTLYDELGRNLLFLAQTFVHSNEIAEEIVQDVFVQLWKHRQKLAPVRNLRLYLYVATKNTCCSYLRRNDRQNHMSIDELSLPYLKIHITPEDEMISNEMLQRIHLAINNLPPKCRQVFKLVKEDGLRYAEVAELLDLNIKTVENQMAIALKKIHSSISSHLHNKLRISQK
jgi:RNA polymerase sigma-70 factor (family 1)